jgi:hypothetical protein
MKKLMCIIYLEKRIIRERNSAMTRPLGLSFTALCVFTCLSCTAQAQDLVPIFQLSAEETAKASHLAQDVTNARQRYDKASIAWRMFQQTYSSAHPNLANVHFTADFRLAFASLGSSTNTDAERQRIKPVELTAEEQQQLKAMHREITESGQSLRQAEKSWVDYQNELVADHFPSDTEGVVVTLSSGKQYVIPSPWSNGLAFTPDFRFAVPLWTEVEKLRDYPFTLACDKNCIFSNR